VSILTRPRYFTSLVCGMISLLNVTGGGTPGRSANVTLANSESLTLIFQDLNQWERIFRWFCSWRFSSRMSWLDESTAVSSALVPIRVLTEVGMFAVNKV